MKKWLAALLLFPTLLVAQKYGNVFGGFETNMQWYLHDRGLNAVPEAPAIRSNNYLLVNYRYKEFTAGIQGEAYEDEALLQYNPGFHNTNVGTWYAQYKNDKIDVTAGYFYEQFGSGLLLRTWEDRQLGINNALRGGRVIFSPFSFLTIKGIYGRQRTGFDVTDSDIFGTDLDISIGNILGFKVSEFSVGGSYVGRDERLNIPDQRFPNQTDAYAGRMNFSHKGFYVSSEFDYKSKDAVFQRATILENDFVKTGNAVLINAGYTQKRFGLDATFRRLENMTFYSERYANRNTFNDRILNYLPALTKQHHFNLANIYVYQTQAGVYLQDESFVQAGDIGGQVDVFYEFKKGSPIGGKFGTKLAANGSNWHGLGGNYSIIRPKAYDTDFIGFGRKYYHEYSLEVTKKWSEKWLTIASYINQFSDQQIVEGGSGQVNTNIANAEATYRFTPIRSLRVVGEHMWADGDKKNWASATAEFNINAKWTVYGIDLYNYGNDDPDARNHYYNVGGSYRRKALRIALNYGRQRGGLVCVGGVCRNVPESTGISLSGNISF